MHYIETKKGLETLLKRLKDFDYVSYSSPSLPALVLKDAVAYWTSVVEGCIKDNLAMDETDWENAPSWFRPLWKGLK